MKKKSRIEMAREIVAYLKREMAQAGTTGQVRNSFTAQTVQTLEEPATSSART